jgi:hypothetical protein
MLHSSWRVGSEAERRREEASERVPALWASKRRSSAASAELVAAADPFRHLNSGWARARKQPTRETFSRFGSVQTEDSAL